MLKKVSAPRKFDYCAACTFYLGAIISTLVCQALAGVASTALAGRVPDIAKNGDFNTAFMIVVQIVNGGFIFFFARLNNYKYDFTVIADKSEKKGAGFYVACFCVPVLCAGLLLVGMYLPTVWYGYFTRYALRMSPDIGSINIETSSALAMLVIASVFLAPVCEEIIYRGVLATGLGKKTSAAKAILLSALAFMLMHMSPAQVVFQFALGAVSAFILFTCKRLLPSVLLHAAANSLALVAELTPLAGYLNACVGWLTNHVAAAVFITLGLTAGCAALIYFTVLLSFRKPLIIRKSGRGETPSDGEEKENSEDSGAADEGNALAVMRDRMLAEARDRDGRVRYFIGIGVCLLLLVVNLISGYLV